MYSLQVQIGRDTLSPAISAIAAGLEARRYLPVVGQACANVFRAHYAALQSDPSRHSTASALGAKPSGLYADFARATSYLVDGDSVEVGVSHVAARQRLRGGPIRPVNARSLTIPANSLAYGKRAADFAGRLVFMWAPDPKRGDRWRPALVAPEAVTKEVGKKRKDGTRRRKTVAPSGVYFWLVWAVRAQAPDPTVLPPERDLAEAVRSSLTDWLSGLAARARQKSEAGK
jgi:hypothetical protein